jgi:hypothetical protein
VEFPQLRSQNITKKHTQHRKIQAILAEIGNPFEEESSELYALDTKDVVDSQVAENMARLPDTGKKQYSNFMNSLNYREKSRFYESLKKDKCAHFSHKAKQDASTSKSKLDILKNDYSLFSRLFISCQSRKCYLRDFFRHENQKYPPSLSQNDTLNLGVKSQLLNILENDINMPSSEPVADTLIIDGTALVNSKPPNVSATFDDYANDVIVPYIQSYAQRHSRIDVVFDVYYDDTLKMETSKKRGTGARRKVTGNSRPPK